jgi:hypothetical protein
MDGFNRISNCIKIQQWDLDWYMTIPLVDVQEDPTGFYALIG